jgi:hypothetical protein
MGGVVWSASCAGHAVCCPCLKLQLPVAVRKLGVHCIMVTESPLRLQHLATVPNSGRPDIAWQELDLSVLAAASSCAEPYW